MPRVDLPSSHAPPRRAPAKPSPADLSSESATEAARPDPAPAHRATPSHRAPRRLTFVTGNPGKVAELAALLGPRGIEVVADGRGYPEVQAASLREVTEAGARHLAIQLQPPFLLEDSGLFVAALRGFPGVYSRNALDTIGVVGLLRLLQDVELEMRTAAFQTDLAYVDPNGFVHHFEGTCKGRIPERAAGTGGFGFDAIFVPEGQGRTFAELDAAQKNAVSHRGRAVAAFLRHLGEAATP